MNRRAFLFKTFYSTLALSFGGYGKAQNAGHMGHSTGALTEEAAMAGFDVRRLIGGESLRDLLVMNHASNAQLMIQPTKHVWLRDGTATNVWRFGNAAGAAMLDVTEGQRVRIDVRNQLSEDTTVHWHGLDVPSDQDGHPHMIIAPMSSRVYEFTLPKGSAGTYWYHPHPHNRVATQVAKGLAAPLIVRSNDDPVAAAGVPEQVLMFTALELDEHGQIAAQTMNEQMNGREGNVLLVNDQYQPVLTVAPNSMLRLRLINASNARYLRLTFGKNTPMVVIAADGGLIERPQPAQTELLLAPAERMEVCVTFRRSAMLQALPYEKGWMDGGMGWAVPKRAVLDVMAVQLAGSAVATPLLPKKLRVIKPLGKPIRTRRFVLTENMQMSMVDGQHNMLMEFMINGRMFDMNRVDFTMKVGEVELWEIVNQTDMDHPFHVHGSQFQVVSVEEKGVVTPYPYLAWKDTVNTRAGQIVRLKIKQSQPGLRMYHCHILEHEDLGMMGQFDVV